jgi:beta-lactamase regulating signal transducer with metallopeptidase domain
MDLVRSLSGSWLSVLVDFTVKSSLILALALLINSFRRRSSAAQRHLIWTLAVGSALVLPLFSFLSSEWDLSIRITERANPLGFPSLADDPSRGPASSRGDFPQLSGEQDPGGGADRQGPIGSAKPKPSVFSGLFTRSSWPFWTILLWIGGTASLTARTLAIAVRARRREDDHPLVDDPVLAGLVREISVQSGIKRSIRVIIRGGCPVPSTRGIFRPLIILPEDAAGWPSDRKRSVLLHEVAHIRRFDHFGNLLARVLCLVFWPNPLVWIAARKMRHDAERACDDRVIGQGISPAVYARILIDFARTLAAHPAAPRAETAMARKSCLEGRLLSIIDDRKPRTRPGRSTAIISWIAASAVAFLIACTEVGEKSYRTEVVDGVSRVHNVFPQSKDRRVLALDFVQSLGGLDEADENRRFFNAIDAAMDDRGNIYVLDSGNFRVQVFDSTGVYKRAIGRKGQGPGELQNGFSLDIAGNGDVVVLDRVKRSVERFDSRGSFIASARLSRDYSYIRMAGQASFYAPLIDVVFPRYVGLMIRASSGRKADEGLNCVAAVSLAGETTREFCPGISEQEGLTSGSQVNANVFEVDPSGNLYIVFKHQNRIDKYSPEGRRLLTIDRPLNFPIEYKPVERLWRSGSVARKFPEFGGTAVSERLGIDGRGRIWVVTYTDQPVRDEKLDIIRPGGKVFEVFTPDGILLTRVPYPDARLVFMRLRRDRLLFTDDEYMIVHEYRIAEF